MNDPSETYLLQGLPNTATGLTWVDLIAAALPIACVLLLLIVLAVICQNEIKKLRGPIYTFLLLYVGYLALTIFLWKVSEDQHSFAHQFTNIAFGVAFFIPLFWLCFRLKKH